MCPVQVTYVEHIQMPQLAIIARSQRFKFISDKLTGTVTVPHLTEIQSVLVT